MMKHIEHPDKLYIQISDEGGENFGIGFTDELSENVDSCDFNDFDDETRQRILSLLRTAYTYVYDRQTKVNQ